MAVAAVSFDWERVRATLPAPLQARVESARELLRRREQVHREAPFSTGIAPLDRLLRGGLEHGALTELSGPRSSGRFAVALQTLAAATQSGEVAALVDLGGQLDPEAAAALGCDLERLLWARTDHLKTTLAAAEALLQTGFSLVVVDLGQPPVPGGRGQEAAWTRLARAAETQRAVLLVSAPYRVSGTAAATVLAARAQRANWAGKGREPRLLAGARSTITLQKSRLQADELRSCELVWTVDSGLPLDSRGPALPDSRTLRPPALSGKREETPALAASTERTRSANVAGADREQGAVSPRAPRSLSSTQKGRAGGDRGSRGGRAKPRTSLERYLVERDRQ